jgi:hypothetical protein
VFSVDSNIGQVREVMCRVNPRVDFVFKKFFGSEENKDLLLRRGLGIGTGGGH